jgi:hypothetical protein
MLEGEGPKWMGVATNMLKKIHEGLVAQEEGLGSHYETLYKGLEDAGMKNQIFDLHQICNYFLTQLGASGKREEVIVESANNEMIKFSQQCEQVLSLLNSEMKQRDRLYKELERENRAQKKELSELKKVVENSEWLSSYHMNHHHSHPDGRKEEEEEEEEKAVAQEMTNPSEKVYPKKTNV